jgi:hypothetical protein
MVGAGLVVVALVVMQYERIITRNLALSHALSSTRAEISNLRLKERKQTRMIDRLSDPHGVIPEIHDRLHLVSPHEELIYLKPAPPPKASPLP